jgi:SAM-dependent methyltransferase
MAPTVCKLLIRQFLVCRGKFLSRYFLYRKDRREFRTLNKGGDLSFGKNYPLINDRFDEAGSARGHYFHQDLLVARRIWENNPPTHVDIGSRIDGFVAHVAVFRPIEIMDIRPGASKIKNISFRQLDLMNLPQDMAGNCDSISSLHAIEHFGLGRYGDPLDPDGHKKAIANIHTMLRPGGKFYFSVPIGPQRIEFNAHRVFSTDYLIALFAGRFVVDDFSYVDDAGELHESVRLDTADTSNNFGCDYGCGIFELTRI